VGGFIAVAECEDAIGQVFNIGSGFEISIKETIDLIADLMGSDVRVMEDEARLRPIKSEVERLCADNSKAARVLGWRPALAGEAGLRAGLELTIDWFRQPENLAKYKTGIFNL
jgi:dTDP-glucose 4,6-dehydratase